MDKHPGDPYSSYACPTCKGPLEYRPQTLCCPVCSRAYPLLEGIPDFLAPATGQPTDLLAQPIERADRGALRWLSRLYEGRIWYPLVIRVYLGKGATSLTDLARRINTAAGSGLGCVLDAACGTATFSRRVAGTGRSVFGIDLSLAMLRTGAEYVQREGLVDVHLARAHVERLPFPPAFFDFAICSGALHLFPDPRAALAEIGRALKPGTRLVGLTFSAGSQGLVQYQWFRRMLKRRGVLRLFQLAELERDFRLAGFAPVELERMGSGVFFTAEKAVA